MRFALLGAGRIGQVHADALSGAAGAELTAVADSSAEAAQAIQERHGAEVLSIEEIAASGDVDAVLICTPTDTHADLIELFAHAGKAVFCEKPVDLEIDRVRACLKTVEDAGAFLMIGFQRRFDPDFNALKSAIDSGKIGNVEMIALTSRDPAPPPISYIERSGGIFRDMAIHDFDVARWLLEEEIETVQAAASNLVDPEIGAAGDADSASVLMTTASGKHCSISCSRRAVYGYDQRIEVHGSKGAISAMNHAEARIELAGPEGCARPPNKHFFIMRYMDAYRAEIEAFAASLTGGRPPPVTGEDGLRALALALAAMRSVDEGRAVKVDEIL